MDDYGTSDSDLLDLLHNAVELNALGRIDAFLDLSRDMRRFLLGYTGAEWIV